MQILQPSADVQRGYGSIIVGATAATTSPQSPRGRHPIGHGSDSLGFVNAGVVAVTDKRVRRQGTEIGLNSNSRRRRQRGSTVKNVT
jgi:hypothetical protein